MSRLDISVSCALLAGIIRCGGCSLPPGPGSRVPGAVSGSRVRGASAAEVQTAGAGSGAGAYCCGTYVRLRKGVTRVTIRLRFAPELRLFLPPRSRASGEIECRYDGTSTLGHHVQAAGVPLTEVAALDAARRPAPGDVVTVMARSRPQPLDGAARLLLDVHLGALARRLRVLGIDTAYHADAADDLLVRQAAEQDRILLSQDRQLLMRRSLRRAAFVRGSLPDQQLADVLGRFLLPLSPYTRCPLCNGALHDVAKEEVLDRLEPGTRRTQDKFWQCEACGQVYWHGAHAKRLDALVGRYDAPRLD